MSTDLTPLPGSLPQGHAIEAKRTTNTLGGGIFFLLFGATFLIPVIVDTPVLFKIPFLLVSVVTIAISISVLTANLREKSKWHPMEVHFQTYPLALGASSVITITRRSKTQIPDSAHVELEMTLTCEEEVIYRSSSGDETKDVRVDKTVVDKSIPVVGIVSNNTFMAASSITIPVDRGGPTFRIDHHSITWQLELAAKKVEKMPADLAAEFIVVPVLAREHINFVDAPPPPGPLDG